MEMAYIHITEDWDLIPCANMVIHNHLKLRFQGICILRLDSAGTRHTDDAHMYLQMKHP